MKTNEKIVQTTLLLSTFLLGAQNIKKIKKDAIFQTSGKIIKNRILTIPPDFVFMSKEVSSDWKKIGSYLGGILGLIAVDKITTKFVQHLFEPNLTYKINVVPQYAKDFTRLHIIGIF
jgi:hypothetical protein